jgi:hypothetical protein
MSARPAPRKSGLAGASPFEPPAPVPPTTAAAAPAADQDTAAEPAPTAARPARATPAKKAGTKYPPKVTFYQDADDTARVRAAILHTMVDEGSRNLSQFVNAAVMAEVERLERKYNNGKPWPAVRSGEMPQGRPMGE